MIEELRRTNKDTKDNKDLLKNVNHAKTPAFLHLEPKKQKEPAQEETGFKKSPKEELGFKKGPKEENHYFLTPKIDKGNY